MKKSVAFRIAVSPVVLGMILASCATSQDALFRPVAATPQEARADLRASQIYALAQQSLQQGDFAQALTQAEKAVQLSPRDAGYRMLLGDLYLKNGRFRSAASAFSDVLTLNPGSDRARFNLALARIALGENNLAMADLERLSQTAAADDLGLAFALAGDAARAVAMLEPAARAADADGRVRQNLALAYALSGDWQRARIVAGQDLSPADLGSRMEEWARFAQPQASHDQVASLLGVTPADDAGQPARLALAPEPAEPVALAVAAPDVPAPEPEAPVALAAVEAAAPVAAQPLYAASVQIPIQPAPAVVKASASPAPAPARASVPAAPLKKTVAARPATGRFVVQLGAYDSARMVEHAWATVQKRYGLAEFAPVSARVTLPNGVFHRLSVAGFASQGEAARTCHSIKAKGGACFVRAVSGDVPVRFASRNARKG